MSQSIVNWNALSDTEKVEVLARPDIQQAKLEEQVSTIISNVQNDGDKTLLSLSKKFDRFTEVDIALPFMPMQNRKIRA